VIHFSERQDVLIRLIIGGFIINALKTNKKEHICVSFYLF